MKKRVGSYKGKPIVELGGGGENTLTKNELSINSFGGSNKYKGEYYRVKEEYQRGYIRDFFSNFFIEGICNTESSFGTFNLINIDDSNGNSSYTIYYVKFIPQGLHEIILPTLKEFFISFSSASEDTWDDVWNDTFSKAIEPCTEEEYYSFFTKTIYDYKK